MTFFAVPLIGALLCYSHTRLAGFSALVGACLAIVALAVERSRYPLHLMPVAAFSERLATPVLGIALAWLISLAFQPVGAGALAVPLLGVWLVSAVILGVMGRLRLSLRIRIGVIGSPELALSLRREIVLADLRGYDVVGWISQHESVRADQPADQAVPCIGSVTDVARLARARGLDLLVFGVRESGGLDAGSGPSQSSLQVLETVSSALASSSTRLMGANQFFEAAFGHTPLATMNAAWFQHILHPRFQTSSPISKRVFDVLVAGLLVTFLFPLMVVCALAIKLGDRGPVLYRQRRLGEAGTTFEVLKFRTMGTDAESGGAARWSSPEDHRVTPVGRYLRRLHLDELPQLLNVLAGQMSLVGPRPERPEFIAQLGELLPYYDRRLTMKPGLTGWAQVRIGYAGSDLGAAWKLAHDLYYLKRRSVVFDALIMLETLATPLRDGRVTERTGDQLFVGAAVRDADEPGARAVLPSRP